LTPIPNTLGARAHSNEKMKQLFPGLQVRQNMHLIYDDKLSENNARNDNVIT